MISEALSILLGTPKKVFFYDGSAAARYSLYCRPFSVSWTDIILIASTYAFHYNSLEILFSRFNTILFSEFKSFGLTREHTWEKHKLTLKITRNEPFDLPTISTRYNWVTWRMESIPSFILLIFASVIEVNWPSERDWSLTASRPSPNGLCY